MGEYTLAGIEVAENQCITWSGSAARSSDYKAFYGNDLANASECEQGCANWSICVTENDAHMCKSTAKTMKLAIKIVFGSLSVMFVAILLVCCLFRRKGSKNDEFKSANL